MQPIAKALISESGAAAEAIVATLLAIAAAALGNRFKIATQAGSPVPATFNLLVAHHTLRNLAWFDMIQHPFICRVHEMQVALQGEGIRATEQRVKQRLAEQQAAIKTKLPDQHLIAQIKRDVALLQAQARPHVTTDRLTPRMIGELLTRSFDSSLLATTTSSDPFDDLGILKPAERREIARVLNLAWSGQPVPMNRGSIAGTVNLLWYTHAANLTRLNVWKEFHGGSMPVPLLILESSEPMKIMEPIAKLAEWDAAINHLFDVRCSAEGVVTLNLTAEARECHRRWEGEHLTALDVVPVELSRHLVWLPQLASRIALLIRLLREEDGNEVSIDDMRVAIAITKVLGAAHLQTLKRIVSFADVSRTDATDGADKTARMLKKITERGPMTRRRLWRSSNDPQNAWFDPALEALIAAGKVAYDAKGELAACSNDDVGGGGAAVGQAE